MKIRGSPGDPGRPFLLAEVKGRQVWPVFMVAGEPDTVWWTLERAIERAEELGPPEDDGPGPRSTG